MVGKTIAAIVRDGRVTGRELVLGLAVIIAAVYLQANK